MSIWGDTSGDEGEITKSFSSRGTGEVVSLNICWYLSLSVQITVRVLVSKNCKVSLGRRTGDQAALLQRTTPTRVSVCVWVPSSAGIITQSAQNKVPCHIKPFDWSCAGSARRAELSLTLLTMDSQLRRTFVLLSQRAFEPCSVLVVVKKKNGSFLTKHKTYHLKVGGRSWTL